MAQRINITIDQGTDFSSTITATDSAGDVMDLSDYTGAGSIRRWYTTGVIASFDINITGNTGIIEYSMDSSVTKDVDGGRYVMDIIITDSANSTIRVAEGIATVKPGVTFNS
jgi:hypothetical protein